MSNYVVNVPVSLTIPVRTEAKNEKEARDNALYAIEKFFKEAIEQENKEGHLGKYYEPWNEDMSENYKKENNV